jgi:dTDP-glucose 4,6-dehydratase
MRVLVTGGAGFIGSAVVRLLLAREGVAVVNVDKLGYAGSRATLATLAGHPRHAFEQVDICDGPALAAAFARHRPDAVLHLAAESHVDRSIDRPADFIQSNIVGTYQLLEVTLAYWQQLPAPERERFRFHHVSTDEVYGSLGLDDPAFIEASPYAPSSPYAASKAAADHLVGSWHRTYGLPCLLSNCTNNYGPFQFPEKLIPLVIQKAVRGEPIPIYGQGINVRDWLYVEDHARALHAILTRGVPGERYNVGAGCERSNLEIVGGICALLDRLRPGDPVVPHRRLITHVTDRPGHDLRYAMDATRLHQTLGWRPEVGFEDGLERTVRWYLDHQDWCRAVTEGSYGGERLGLGSA